MALILDQGLIRDPEFGVQPLLLDQLPIIGLEAVVAAQIHSGRWWVW